MNRRAFLGSMALSAAGLWLPGEERQRVRVYSFVTRPKGKPRLCIYDGQLPNKSGAPLTSGNVLLSEMDLDERIAPHGLTHFSGADYSANSTGAASFARIFDGYGDAVVDLKIDVPAQENIIWDDYRAETWGVSRPGPLLLPTRYIMTGWGVRVQGSFFNDTSEPERTAWSELRIT